MVKNQNGNLDNSNDKDILQDIDENNLHTFRDLFKQNWPYYAQAYYFINNYINWKLQHSEVHINLTCPEGKWEDGTFVAMTTKGLYHVFVFTLENSNRRLCRALKETKRINWSRGPVIFAIHQDIMHDVVPVLRKLNKPIECEQEVKFWILPCQNALDFNIGSLEGVYMAPLRPSNAHKINAEWPHKSSGSLEYVSNLIIKNGGVGLFDKFTNELCSWVILNDLGTLGLLHTTGKYRSKGYAKIVVKEMSRMIALKGFDVASYTVQGNLNSDKLFQSLGFTVVHQARWVQFLNMHSH